MLWIFYQQSKNVLISDKPMAYDEEIFVFNNVQYNYVSADEFVILVEFDRSLAGFLSTTYC